MLGQAHDRSPGVEELFTTGGEADRVAPAVDPAGRRRGTTRTDRPVVPSTGASDAPPAGRPDLISPQDLEVVIAPEWLADLHDPSLVISHGYVGPDRRRVDRTPTPPVRQLPSWVRHVFVVVFLTAVVVTPLTMISARSIPPATVTQTPAIAGAPGSGSPAPKGGGSAGRHVAHVITATPAEVARADAAYERALAREQAANSPAPTGPGATGESVTGTASPGSPASAATGSAAAARAQAAQQRAQAQAQAAQQRAAAQAQAAQQRAAAQAAAAQRQADRAAARAQAKVARAASRAGPGATTPAG